MSNKTYYTVLTKLGEQLLAKALSTSQPLKITTMAVGDGNGSTPKHTATSSKLINEKYRAAVTTLTADKANPSQLIVEQILPETVGGFWVREVALYDNGNNLIAIGNCPETYKPNITDGAGSALSVGMYVAVNSTSAVEIKMGPANVYVSEQYAKDNLVQKSGDTVIGNLIVKGVIRTDSARSFRHISGDISTMWHLDGQSLSLLMTDHGNPEGSYNSLRPFVVNMTSGDITFGQTINVKGKIQNNGIDVIKSGDFGLGVASLSSHNIVTDDSKMQYASLGAITTKNHPPSISGIADNGAFVAITLPYRTQSTVSGNHCFRILSTPDVHGVSNNIPEVYVQQMLNTVWSRPYKIFSEANTVVDSNGFIKAASPVVRLFNDQSVINESRRLGFSEAGFCVTNSEADGVTAKRIDIGHYQITGSLGFAKEGWYIETPADANGNKLLFVDYFADDNHTITVKTYKKRFDLETGNFMAGEPMDILDGRWIDLRLDMPEKENLTPSDIVETVINEGNEQ